MTLDDAFERLGRFGRYQVVTYFMCCFASQVPSYWQLFAIVFIGYINPHRCKLPPNTTVEDAIPQVPGADGQPTLASCSMYRNASVDNSTTACTAGYVYQADGFNPGDGTITMEWNLVCDKDAYVELSQTIFSVGVVAGFFFFTPFADRFGRRRLFFICQGLMAIFGFILAFSPDFTSFCVCQFLTGAFASGLYVTGMVMAFELFPVSLRSTMAPLTPLFATVAMTTVPVWAYFLRSWRHLQLGISVAGGVYIFYYWFCPESLRWLLANDRKEDCEKILKKAAKFNGKIIPDGILDDEIEKTKAIYDKGGANFLRYLQTPRTRSYMFIIMYMKFVNNIMFFGLALMMGALDGNLYFNFFLNAVVDVPAIILVVLIMPRIGRRYPLVFFHIFAGIFMALSGGMSMIAGDGVETGKWVLAFALVARVGIGGVNAVGIIYVQELFPTNLRSTGLGITEGVGFIGAILSPFTVYLFRLVNWLPGTVFGAVSIIGGFCAFFLPETVGRNLPLTVEEIASWTRTLTKEEKAEFKNHNIFNKKKKIEDDDMIYETRL